MSADRETMRSSRIRCTTRNPFESGPGMMGRVAGIVRHGMNSRSCPLAIRTFRHADQREGQRNPSCASSACHFVDLAQAAVDEQHIRGDHFACAHTFIARFSAWRSAP